VHHEGGDADPSRVETPGHRILGSWKMSPGEMEICVWYQSHEGDDKERQWIQTELRRGSRLGRDTPKFREQDLGDTSRRNSELFIQTHKKIKANKI
jgi:hypothetical protein